MKEKQSKKLTKEEREDIEIASMEKVRKEFRFDDLNLDIKCKTDGQFKLVDSIRSKEITICSGPAGTGKTYLACSEALRLIKEEWEKYKKIVLVKSVTTLKDEEIGFLKGTMEEKMEPFVFSFIHNFQKIVKSKHIIEELRAKEIIEVMPIAYMRGINLDNSIVIIDEAQNISIENMRTILTRLGSNSKMIFLGDQKQIDRKNKLESSLDFLIDNFSEIKEMGLVRLTSSDIVRNPLIKKIEAKFEEVFSAAKKD